MDEIYKNVTSIQNIQKDFESNFIPQITNESQLVYKYMMIKLQKDQLRFKYKWEKFDLNAHLKLINYILDKPVEWILNDNTLTELEHFFDDKFPQDILRRKCQEYGIEYQFN